MNCLRAVFFSAGPVLAAAGLSGCFPAEENHLDEEKDPHFQRGRDLVTSQEFKAAGDEFEKALESNPRSAAAHYELGWLCDNKFNDFAAAIYHYERYLELAHNSPHAPQVRERIRGCKLELASTEFPLANSQSLQQELEKVSEENRLLRMQLDAARSGQAADSAVPAAPLAVSVAPGPRPVLEGGHGGQSGPVAPATTPPRATPVAAASGRPRVYVIQAKDTISAVAARYGLKPAMVLAANPSINPTRLHVGQSLNLP